MITTKGPAATNGEGAASNPATEVRLAEGASGPGRDASDRPRWRSPDNRRPHRECPRVGRAGRPRKRGKAKACEDSCFERGLQLTRCSLHQLSTSGRDGAGSGNGVFGGLRNLFTSPRSSASPPPQTVAQVVSQGANGTGNGNKPDGRGNPGVGGGGGGLNQEGLNPNAILMGSLGSYNRSEEAYPVSRASYVRQRNALDSLVQFLGL
eukprot:scaffold3457_cov230-Pinguiococcus_pyrenoidosus.AAC.8